MHKHTDDGIVRSENGSANSLEKGTQEYQLEKLDTVGQEIYIDPEIDITVTKKFDRNILPLLFVLWLLAFIDRSNIGNARVDGLATQLGIDSIKFNITLAVFYVPYIVVDIPSNWLLKYFGAGKYLPFLIICWGVVSMCTGFVKSYTGLIIARFFLGMCEGGFLGGVIIYLAMFYQRKQLMQRIGLFYCAAPLSGCLGGLLATGLSEIKDGNYNGWPWIFFVEGAITIVAGIVAMFFMPDTPSACKFLTPDEEYVATHRMKLDAHGAQANAHVADEHFSWHWVRTAIFNWNTILLSINFFAIITPIYSYSLFLPTIISGLGYKAVQANLLSVPPNFLAFLSVILVTYLSDKIKRRGVFMLSGATLAICGYIMLISTANTAVQYAGTFLVAAGIFPTSPIVMGWLATNCAPHYVRATATGFQIMIANCAAFIATFTYLPGDAPRYITGHAINIGTLCLCLCITSTTMLYCTLENKKRERGDRNDRLAGDQALLGHRHPHFRYAI